MDTITAYIEREIYSNEKNGYRVLIGLVDGKEKTIVGTFGRDLTGLTLRVSGTDNVRKKYDLQFEAQSYEIIEPSDSASIFRYLSSGAVSGIGEALAGRIVDMFGDETMDIIEREPERLAKVKGISLRKAQNIAVQVEEKKGARNAMLFLQKYGIPFSLSLKLYEYYKDRIYSVLRENPYQMVGQVEGVGFLKADHIAKMGNVCVNSSMRIACGVVYILKQALADGNMYMPMDNLVAQAMQILEISEEELRPELSNMMMDRKIIIQSDRVYEPSAFYAETNVAHMLGNICSSKFKGSEEQILSKVQKIEARQNIELDDLQRHAVVMSVLNPILLLTGGPGTGKTTTINTIIEYFVAEGNNIALAAPTGRAAKRMTQATGYEASTIHRLLEVRVGDGEKPGFDRNEDYPLEEDVIIIDEMSMVDIFLFQALLKAVCEGARLILVGDMNQLPSVGPGQVLKDLRDSAVFPCVELETIFRQAKSSDIIKNAHLIKEGKEIVLDNKSSDFFFLRREDTAHIYNNIVQLTLDKLPKYVKTDKFDIQIMTPMKKGPMGVETLNPILQKYLNPPSDTKKEYTFGDHLFREQDKVMQIKNNYQIEGEYIVGGIAVDTFQGVYNGDVGRIAAINEFMKEVVVEFDDHKVVHYSFEDLGQLELSYAITIHKSQGSEYDAIILPLFGIAQIMMYRNLLYTAVTRAKKCVVLIGTQEIISQMIENENGQKRYSTLALRIQEIIG